MFENIQKGDMVTVIYKAGTGKNIMQGYVRYIDARYLILGMGFKDDWLNLKREQILEVRKNVSKFNTCRDDKF